MEGGTRVELNYYAFSVKLNCTFVLPPLRRSTYRESVHVLGHKTNVAMLRLIHKIRA
ncbi:MAG: hypothetical protein ACI9ND_001084 [Yoonia sp.]|jgi:hypothetical protein